MEPQDEGLTRDIGAMLDMATTRRQSLRWLLAAAAAVPLAGCSRAAGTVGSVSCQTIPDETAGPFPGDGSNRNARGVANALALAGIVRRDIRASVGGASGVAAGVPLTLSLQVVDVTDGCKPIAGAVVYLWHCDSEGRYSMYSPGLEDENYLRGMQEADSNGVVTFTTIFPGCYPGRVPHMHFEVYPSLARARSDRQRLKTSQLAFPVSAVAEAYKGRGYERSAEHSKEQTFEGDMVFANDGSGGSQIASVSGSLAQGFTATLTLGVAGA